MVSVQCCGHALKWGTSGYRRDVYLDHALNPIHHGPVSFANANFTAFTGDPVAHVVLFSLVNSIVGPYYMRDRGVVSDGFGETII